MINMLGLSLEKLLSVAYGLYLRHKFHFYGKGSRIHFPATIVNPYKIDIGNNVSIAQHCWMNCEEPSRKVALTIGDNCLIGRFAHINALEKVVIEDCVLIAERVHISDLTHIYSDPVIPIIFQGRRFKGAVIIKKGAWICSGAVILPGVTVGKNAVVGANAVVAKDVPDNFVARGIPAKMFPKSNKE